MSDRLSWVIVVVALIGIGLSTASLAAHYKKNTTEFCDINDTFNCDIVNRSVYSRMLGVPVAGIGLVGYIMLLILSRVNREKKLFSAVLVAGSIFGLGFSLYLTYIEARVLYAYCMMCLGSLACIAAISVLAILRHVRTRELVF